jgi:hypothetical protein
MSEDGKSDDMMQASGASSLDVSRVAHYQKWKDASRYSNMPRKVNAQPEGCGYGFRKSVGFCELATPCLGIVMRL